MVGICLARLFGLQLNEGFGQLVGAAGATAMAIDAFKPSDHIVDFHAFDKGGDALEVAVASPNNFEIDDRVPIIDDVHLPRAYARRLEHIGLFHGLCLSDDGAEYVIGFSA